MRGRLSLIPITDLIPIAINMEKKIMGEGVK
jgi:hypothetical protein